MTITIVDYGVGNLGSIQNAFKKLGAVAVITADSRVIGTASKLILPGVGSFDAGMSQLNSSGLRNILDDAVLNRKVPVMGVCLGMQLMTQSSEEGQLQGLGWIRANTIRFAPKSNEEIKVPNMGWSNVTIQKQSNILKNIDNDARFYFVHSFYVSCIDRNDALLGAQYGSTDFDAAFEKDNILGFQFHPEKSHRFGLAIFKGFLENC